MVCQQIPGPIIGQKGQRDMWPAIVMIMAWGRRATEALCGPCFVRHDGDSTTHVTGAGLTALDAQELFRADTLNRAAAAKIPEVILKSGGMHGRSYGGRAWTARQQDTSSRDSRRARHPGERQPQREESSRTISQKQVAARWRLGDWRVVGAAGRRGEESCGPLPVSCGATVA